MSAEVDIYQPAAGLAVPDHRDIDSWIAVASDVIKIAKVIYDTPFVPEGLRGSEPAVAAAILAGREMGLGPMTSLQHIHVIKGKPGQSALLMRALIQARGHKWEDVDVSDTRAVVKGCRKGESAWAEASFTADQARKAGIDLGKYPQDKLYARAAVRLARRKFADVIMGMPYSAEELEDGEADEGTVTETAAASNGGAPAPKPAARTARRRQPPQEPADRPSAAPSAPGSEGATQDRPPRAPAATARSGQPSLPPTEMIPAGTEHAGLPPLPGEDEPAADAPDETDYDTPGTVTREQLTAMWATFSSDLGFGKDDKPYARQVCEKITGRQLLGGTTGNLSRNEASACIDTLKLVRTRDRLIVLMNDGELPVDAEPAGGGHA